LTATRNMTNKKM